MRGGHLLRFLSDRVRVAFVASVLLFLWCVAQFHERDTGFSSLISIGELLRPSQVSALKQVPHYVYEGSPGYDGAYYVQLALYPTLDNPELAKAIDNLPYRARRILFCWAAWLLGVGHAPWIVQAHALLNVLCWLGLAFLLLRWFPLTNWQNFLRWAGVMFSHGVCMSVRHSLVDAPSLLLVALGIRWLELGRNGAGVGTLALAGLGKETSVLAASGIDFSWREPRTWPSTLLRVVLVALPLVLWMGFIRWKFGRAEDPGLGNFTLPFAGFAERLGVAWHELIVPDRSALSWAVFATVVSLAVQWGFIALRWRPAERWWRVGAAFALMMVFLSTPVWEGYPGAATRVLLPMTLAFNILVPRGPKWLPLLLAGNLSVTASVFEFSPPHDFYQVRGASAEAVRVVAGPGWHGPERHLDEQWRWSRGRAELQLRNTSSAAVAIAVRGQVTAAGKMRSVRVQRDEKLVWGDFVGTGAAEMRFGLELPPGDTLLIFSSEEPPQKVDSDPRDLAYRVSNLEIVVRPSAASR